MTAYFLIDCCINYSNGSEVDDIANRSIDRGHVDRLVQTYLNRTDYLGKTHLKKQAIDGVSSTQVGEYESVHVFSKEVIEWEMSVAQLLVHCVVHLHFTINYYFGILLV